MALTKKQIAQSVSHGTGTSPNKANQSVDNIFEILKSTVASGEDVRISGFGKFKVNEKLARKGRNPVTGEAMMLAPQRVGAFN